MEKSIMKKIYRKPMTEMVLIHSNQMLMVSGDEKNDVTISDETYTGTFNSRSSSIWGDDEE
jgi:hypothetical protein